MIGKTEWMWDHVAEIVHYVEDNTEPAWTDGVYCPVEFTSLSSLPALWAISALNLLEFEYTSGENNLLARITPCGHQFLRERGHEVSDDDTSRA